MSVHALIEAQQFLRSFVDFIMAILLKKMFIMQM